MSLPYGQPIEVAQNIKRITCNNPSPLTGAGTNSFLVGTSDLALVDPGPIDDAHCQAIMDALEKDQRISHIFVTHSHLDHSPLAARVASITGAKVHALGDSTTGRSDVMSALAQTDALKRGEEVDQQFAPDVRLNEGQVIEHAGWRITAHHTPGHFANHMSFAVGDVELCGDLIMAWATSLVAPPDGDLTQFITSCEQTRTRAARKLLPAHGEAIEDPQKRIEWLISHRMERTKQIIRTLEAGPKTPKELTQQIYSDINPNLWPAAEQNVLAHLIDLMTKKFVSPEGILSIQSKFRLLEKIPS